MGGNHLGLVLLERVVVNSVKWLLRIDLVRVLPTGWWWWGKWVLLFTIECMRLGWSIVLIYVNAVYLELLHQILLNYLNWRCIRFSLRRLAFLGVILFMALECSFLSWVHSSHSYLSCALLLQRGSRSHCSTISVWSILISWSGSLIVWIACIMSVRWWVYTRFLLNSADATPIIAVLSE